MPNKPINLGLRLHAAHRLHALNLSAAVKTLVMQAAAAEPEAVAQALRGQRFVMIEIGREPGIEDHLLATLTVYPSHRKTPPAKWERPHIERGDRVVYVNEHGSATFGTVAGPHYARHAQTSELWDVFLGKSKQSKPLHPRDLMKVEPYAPDVDRTGDLPNE